MLRYMLNLYLLFLKTVHWMPLSLIGRCATKWRAALMTIHSSETKYRSALHGLTLKHPRSPHVSLWISEDDKKKFFYSGNEVFNIKENFLNLILTLILFT